MRLERPERLVVTEFMLGVHIADPVPGKESADAACGGLPMQEPEGLLVLQERVTSLAAKNELTEFGQLWLASGTIETGHYIDSTQQRSDSTMFLPIPNAWMPMRGSVNGLIPLPIALAALGAKAFGVGTFGGPQRESAPPAEQEAGWRAAQGWRRQESMGKGRILVCGRAAPVSFYL